MITPIHPLPTAGFSALAGFLLENSEPLINAVATLGGVPAVKRTARLLEDMTRKTRLDRRLGREAVVLHRLLTLDAVDEPDSLEAGLFAQVDPASPIVEEICLLADGLRDRLEALVKEEDDQGLLAATLAQAA